MIGFDSFIIKYGYYSIRSLISIYDVELPPEIDSYTESELIPLLRIIMTRFNMRRQKLKTVNTIEVWIYIINLAKLKFLLKK